jgi:hypothetical protein
LFFRAGFPHDTVGLGDGDSEGAGQPGGAHAFVVEPDDFAVAFVVFVGDRFDAVFAAQLVHGLAGDIEQLPDGFIGAVFLLQRNELILADSWHNRRVLLVEGERKGFVVVENIFWYSLPQKGCGDGCEASKSGRWRLIGQGGA